VNGGERVAEVLSRQGVRFLFTLCGGHISPILVACKRRGIRVVDTRHEATAAFAADAVSRLTGAPGVAAVTAGPGVTNTITAVKNAQLAQSPVILLGGATATMLKGRGALQDIDQLALFRPHVKWAVSVARVRDLAPAVERAFAVARQGVPGPVFVECPVDLLYDEPLVREWYAAAAPGPGARGLAARGLRWYLGRHVDRLFAGGGEAADVAPTAAADAPAAPPASDVARGARRLARAERPLLLIGSQALLLAAETAALRAAVERLGLPVYLAGMARGLLGRDHPLQRRHQRRQALREADLVILAGVPCDFRLDYGRQIGRGATLVSANRSRADLRKNRRPTVGVAADPALFLRALAEQAPAPAARLAPWLAQLAARDAARERAIAEEAAAEPADGKLNPLRLCRELEAALPENGLLVADGGDFVATASYVLRPRAPLTWLDPGVFGTLGCGAGFALGAKLCRPEAEVWTLFGDGALGYGLTEYDTFARHGVPVIGVVGNDAGWTQIARDQVPILGDDVGTTLAPSDYERAVEGLGARGFALRAGDDVASVLAAARAAAAAGEPVLINAHLGRSEFRQGSLSM
jgi:acetolactate synthase-1/2/3 large subunit